MRWKKCINHLLTTPFWGRIKSLIYKPPTTPFFQDVAKASLETNGNLCTKMLFTRCDIFVETVMKKNSFIVKI